jgi:hypothetical protein
LCILLTTGFKALPALGADRKFRGGIGAPSLKAEAAGGQQEFSCVFNILEQFQAGLILE